MAETQTQTVTTSNNGGVELEEVEIQGGVKVKLPKPEADAYRTARTKDKAEREDLASRYGAAKAEKDAETTRAAKAEQDKRAAELAKAGEVEKLRELLTKESTEKVDRLASRYRDTHLRSAIGSHPTLLKLADSKAQQALVDDVAAQLRGSCRFDIESDMLVISGADGRPALGPDGKPVQVDAWIAQHIDARPYLRQPTKAPGSGAAGGGSTTTGPSITQAAFDAMPPLARAKHFEAGGSIVG